MTIGVGGSTADRELSRMTTMRDGVQAITDAELERRMEKARRLMREQRIQALYLDASTSLYYFTGLRARQSERLHGAVIPATASGFIRISSTAKRIIEEKTRYTATSIPAGSPFRSIRNSPNSSRSIKRYCFHT